MKYHPISWVCFGTAGFLVLLSIPKYGPDCFPFVRPTVYETCLKGECAQFHINGQDVSVEVSDINKRSFSIISTRGKDLFGIGCPGGLKDMFQGDFVGDKGIDLLIVVCDLGPIDTEKALLFESQGADFKLRRIPDPPKETPYGQSGFKTILVFPEFFSVISPLFDTSGLDKKGRPVPPLGKESWQRCKQARFDFRAWEWIGS
jgi:hypothetical protein